MLIINIQAYIKGVDNLVEQMPKLIELNKTIHPYAQVVDVKVIDGDVTFEKFQLP